MWGVWNADVQRDDDLPEGEPVQWWVDTDGLLHIRTNRRLSDEDARAWELQIKSEEQQRRQGVIPGLVAALGAHVRHHVVPAAAVGTAAIATGAVVLAIVTTPHVATQDAIDARPDTVATTPGHPAPAPPTARPVLPHPVVPSRRPSVPPTSPMPTSTPTGTTSLIGSHPLAPVRTAIGPHPLAPARSVLSPVVPRLHLPLPSHPPLKSLVPHPRLSLPLDVHRPRP